MTWKQIRFGGALLALGLVVAGRAAAEGMQVEPGQWEFKTVAEAPMMPAPIVNVEKECVTDSELHPQTFLRELKGCKIKDSGADASSMYWKMTCDQEGGRMDGDASVRSTGTAIEGGMTLVMSAGGQKFTMTHTWEGKRLGACP